MGYLLNEEQKSLQDMARDFAEKSIKPQAAEYDRSGEFPEELYRQAFEMGLHCLEIPEEYGGSGLDSITAAAIYEELGKADAGFATGLCAIGLALKPVMIAGTPEQKKLFADIVVPGAFAAFCLTEADAGSDAGATKTTVLREGDEYVINGAKCFITNGAVAEVYVVFATHDKSKGLKGISAFLVERRRAGITVSKEEDKMGIRLSNTCEVVLDQVRIPAGHLLGKEDEGFKIAMKTLDMSRPVAGTIAVGVAQRALDEAVKYAKERVTFGKPIGAMQAIQFMMADMDMKIEAARQLNIHALACMEAGLPFSREAAMGKCLSGDIAVEVALDAIQILGGYGYSREYPVEKLLRDAKIFQIFEGTNQIQRMVVASQLLR